MISIEGFQLITQGENKFWEIIIKKSNSCIKKFVVYGGKFEKKNHGPKIFVWGGWVSENLT